MARRPRYSRLAKLSMLMLLTVIVTISMHYITSHRSTLQDWLANIFSDPPTPPKPVKPVVFKQDPWQSSAFLEGTVVTNRFRDRLHNNTNYITTWTDGGFTNALMTYANLIYLGIISNRVPVIPPFVAYHHIDASAGALSFGNIFDLPGLRDALRIPILEWSDIKKLPSKESPGEPIGCWSAWATGNLNEYQPRYNTGRIVSYLGLDIAYTPVPHSTRRRPEKGEEYDWGLLFWRLAALIYPSTARDVLPQDLQAPFSSQSGVSIPPDTQLACFDMLYFVTADRNDNFEWSDPWNTSWRAVARHMKFRKHLVDLAKAYLRRAFRIPSSSAIPPFISVHIRHGDFGGACGEAVPKEDCFAPLSAYATRVKEVQEELVEKKGLVIPDNRVLVTSDETNPTFWAKVKAQGWSYYNHTAEATHKLHGEWYITLIDVVTPSLSVGFVGTDRSTVTTVNQKRVEDWNGGVTRIVKWGKPDADAH